MDRRRDTTARLHRIAARQHELVTRAQLIEQAGLTAAAIDSRVRRGHLHVIHRGVYAIGSGRLTPAGRWLAGVLACGPRAVLAGGSAAALWGIGPMLLSPVHVIVAGNRRSRPGLVVHRSVVEEDERHERLGIPTTSVRRTLADLAEPLRSAAASKAVVLRLLTPEEIEGPVFRSQAERRFHAEHTPPLTNVRIEGAERDFVWPEQRLVVELDGPHHRLAHERRADERRDEVLRRAGWRVVRRSVED